MTNLPPTDLELYEIQTTILPRLDLDILAVDFEATVTPAFEALDRERKALENIKNNFENIISAQRCIPPEIWSEIFLYGNFLDTFDREEDEFDWPSRTIWHLSQVCQTWRNLALSLHSCWSSIVLDFSSDKLVTTRDVELLVSCVLERSHQHLLDITLLNHGIEKLSVPLCRMRDKVFAESHRWRTARLVDSHQVRLRPDLLYAPLRGRLPLLEHLEFETATHYIIIHDDPLVISAFKDCPRLVTVGLIGANPRTIELPVERITCLRLCDQARPGCFRAYVDLASQCPSLDVLRVDLQLEVGEDSPVKSITLPILRELKAIHPDLLDSLTLPRLEVAALDQENIFPHLDTLYAFHCLIRRSNCASNLTELRIMQVPLNLHHSEPHLVLSVLSQTTALATLQLEANIFDFRLDRIDEWSTTQVTDVMKALEVVAGQRVVFLPRLVSIDIEVTGHTDLYFLPYLRPPDDFVGMLKARHEVGLGRFHFGVRANYGNGPESVFDDHENCVLRGLVEDGMSLEIRFNGVLASGL